MTPVLIDTSVIVALLGKGESARDRCARAIEKLRPPLLTCEAVIAESCYLLQYWPLGISRIFENLAQGKFQIAFDLKKSSSQVGLLIDKYADTPADFADACLIQMADELNTGKILTLDSDFQHYRWRKNKRFQSLVPLK